MFSECRHNQAEDNSESLGRCLPKHTGEDLPQQPG